MTITWRSLWAIGLILAGVLILLINLNILPGAVWNYFFPALLVVVGAALLLGVRRRDQVIESVKATAPLDGAERANITLKHGAGHMLVHASSNPSLLFEGMFDGGIDKEVSVSNGTAFVELKSPDDLWTGLGFMAGRGIEWDLALNPTLPTALKYEGGAADTKMDLSGIRLTNLEINTGASSTEIVLPIPSGTERVSIKAGAASVKVRVPPNALTSIHGVMGMGSLKIDQQRFPGRGASLYESENYAGAADRIEIAVEGGVGSVEIS